jgi:hypothetical protein
MTVLLGPRDQVIWVKLGRLDEAELTRELARVGTEN